MDFSFPYQRINKTMNNKVNSLNMDGENKTHRCKSIAIKKYLYVYKMLNHLNRLDRDHLDVWKKQYIYLVKQNLPLKLILF